MSLLKKMTLIFLALLLPGWAYANAGVPMLFLAMPVFVFSLLPIIAIETFYISKSLEIRLWQSLKTVTVSNLISTAVGIPLTWLLLVFVQTLTGGTSAHGIDSFIKKIGAVTWQAPWLMAYEKEFNWMIPAAGLFLLVPFFFASWWTESFVSKKMLHGLSSQKINLKVRNANLLTYGLLATWPVAFWVFNGFK